MAWTCFAVLATGVVIILVGMLGWYAGFSGNVKICYVYVCLLLMIVILQAVFAVLGL